MKNSLPENIWIVEGADDPALEFTAMREKEYDVAVQYSLTSTVKAKLESAEKVVEALKLIEKGETYHHVFGYMRAGRSCLINIARNALDTWDRVNLKGTKS